MTLAEVQSQLDKSRRKMHELMHHIQSLEKSEALYTQRMNMQEEVESLQATIREKQAQLEAIDVEIRDLEEPAKRPKMQAVKSLMAQAMESKIPKIYLTDGHYSDPTHPFYGYRTIRGHREYAGIIPLGMAYQVDGGFSHPDFESAKKELDERMQSETFHSKVDILKIQAIMDEAARLRRVEWDFRGQKI